MLQTTAAPSIMPSSQRPVPLTMRADLIVERMQFRGILYCVIKDPVALKYHRLRPEQYHVLQQLDGVSSLEQLRDDLAKRYPGTHWTVKGLQSLIGDLHEKRLVVSDRAGQEHGLARQRRKKKLQKIKQTAQNFLFLRLPGWDPHAALKVLYPFVTWMFHPVMVWGCILAIAASSLFLLTHFDEFTAALPAFGQFFGWPNLLWLWLTIACTKILHEFGHGLTCRHFGGECHEMGVMLLVFSPTLYCDVSDSWMMRNKWHRIYIGAAGMYIEAVISTLALWTWWNTQPGTLNMLALNVFFITTVSSVIFNLNPLMRLDGYYMLSDYLEIPNLRQRADKFVSETFGKYCLGIEPQPDPFAPDSGKVGFVTYAILATLYKYFIIIAISLFLYSVLKPYRLQSLGAALAIMSMVGLTVKPVMGVVKLLKQPREKPLSKFKIGATLFVTAAVVAAVLCIPVPTVVSAAFTIEPRGVQHVYTSVPGKLVDVRVKPGDAVDAGDTLAVLEDIPAQAQRADLQNQIRIADQQLKDMETMQDFAGMKVTLQKKRSLEAQLATLEDRMTRLEIKAPVSGTIYSPPKQPEPPVERAVEQLPRWYGEPLDERNVDTMLDKQTLVASIAPSDEMDAVLLIDQADTTDVREGDQIGIKFDHIPERKYVGTITEFSQRQQDTAPEALSNKAGGAMATVTDAAGQERLISVAYQAKVPLEIDEESLMPGLRGRARCLIRERPLGSVIWRYLRRQFHFRL